LNLSRKLLPEGAPWLGALAIALAGSFLVHDHTRLDSASYDEPVHIHAGWLQVSRHDGLANIEHPPLVKELAGLAVARLHPSDVPEGPAFDFAGSAHRFLFENRVSPDAILAAARAPMLLFFVALVLVVFGAAKRWFGTPAAFLSAALVAFEPVLLAHAGIVQTDLPVALFWVGSVLAWGRLMERRSRGRIAAAGLLLGLALSTKFSAVYLFPTFALLSVVGRTMAAPAGARKLRDAALEVLRDAAAGIAATLVALAVVLAVYAPAVSGIRVPDQQTVIGAMVGTFGKAPALAARIAAISPVSRPVAEFAGGLASVVRQSSVGLAVSFLNGRISAQGFPGYFFAAFALKSGIPLLLAAAAAAVLLFLRRADRRDVLLWVPIVYYFLFSIGSTYNIGVRHILPVYPFLAIAAGRLVPDFAARGIGRRAAGAAFSLLVAAQLATAAAAHPHELSYFNVFAGGTANGYRRLCDSNSDWGLDLRRLTAELSRRGVRDATIVYFGGDDVYRRTGLPDFAAVPVVHGELLAISTTLWDIGPAYYAVNGRGDASRALWDLIRRLRGRPPAGSIGGSTLLFRLGPSPPDSAILPQTR
jgi:hypothetical protein